MNLAEFLLARIAEDERVAELSETHGSGRTPTPYWQKLTNGVGQGPSLHASRLRAECAAKRQIINLVRFYLLTEQELRDRPYEHAERLADDIGEGVLRNLALPYAEHPDYREEWRLT